jgi:hypothetical protein
MVAFVNLYSKNKGELNNFLSKFYNNNLKITDDNSWEKDFNNPVEIAELVGAYIDTIGIIISTIIMITII